jgi:hypothetical protein
VSARRRLFSSKNSSQSSTRCVVGIFRA